METLQRTHYLQKCIQRSWKTKLQGKIRIRNGVISTVHPLTKPTKYAILPVSSWFLIHTPKIWNNHMQFLLCVNFVPSKIVFIILFFLVFISLIPVMMCLLENITWITFVCYCFIFLFIYMKRTAWFTFHGTGVAFDGPNNATMIGSQLLIMLIILKSSI